MTITFVAFLVLIVIGAPIVFALGVSAALTIYFADIPISIVAQRMYAGLDSCNRCHLQQTSGDPANQCH